MALSASIRRLLRHPATLAAVWSSAFAIAGDVALPDPVAARGLTSTTRDAALVARSIEKANLLLAEASLHLRPTWGASGNGIPVYLVSFTGVGASSPLLVPHGCRCVFVDPRALADWTVRHSTGKGRMEIDRTELLAFMLLHEAGHLARETSGGAIERGGVVRYNTDPSRAKADEEDADDFAASLVRTNKARTPASSASLQANFIATEILKLGWNMQAYRTLDEFGSYVTGKPGVYHDLGYSHPNLAWRILRTNHLIHRSPETAELLEHFEEARRRSRSGR